MDLFLSVLKNFGFDHHSRYLAEMYAKIVKMDLPNITAYFNSRMLTTPYTKLVTEGELKEDLFSHATAPSKADLERIIFGKSNSEL